jgi:hypothetical protein
MSEFVYLYRATPDAQRAAMGTPAQAQRSLERYLTWLRTLEAGGHLKQPGQPLLAEGSVVRKDRVVTDGPYIEAKDMVLGFIVVEARDLAQAIELAHGCPILDSGSIEIRPVAPDPRR